MYKAEQLSTVYNHERHVALCETLDRLGHLPSVFMLLPPKVTHDESDMVWDDIVFMRTLNLEQSRGNARKHICPLPLDVAERVIRLYSNPYDLVLDPFAGLFTVVMKAVEMGRRGYGMDLNYESWRAGVKYCQDAERRATSPTLFDLLQFESVGAVRKNGDVV
jgi:DNA modification methylase